MIWSPAQGNASALSHLGCGHGARTSGKLLTPPLHSCPTGTRLVLASLMRVEECGFITSLYSWNSFPDGNNCH